MATVEAPVLLTTEQLLAMPDDGVERWLIRGQLREKPKAYRDRWSARALARIVHFLEDWRGNQPRSQGCLLGGNVGVRLRRDPDTTLGIDVVYISSEVAASNPEDAAIIDGGCVLAVEILSPNDTVGEIDEKIDEYQVTRVPILWVIHPRRRTVTIYRPDQEPVLLNATQELSGEPELPDFRVRVAELFA